MRAVAFSMNSITAYCSLVLYTSYLALRSVASVCFQHISLAAQGRGITGAVAEQHSPRRYNVTIA